MYQSKILILGISLSIASSMVHAQNAIATTHPLATQAGFEIFNQGGNAFDAAVAVSAALAVVEPHGSGLGGGGFWLLHSAKDQKNIMIDGREKAPAKAHRDMYLDVNGNVIEGLSVVGPLSAGIPGSPAALDHINQKFGALTLAQNLAPAIRFAKEGFEVDEHFQKYAKFRKSVLNKFPATAAVYLQNGNEPSVGHLIKQPELANTLELIASQGAKGFYTGDFAKKLINGVNNAGGIWSLADLSNYNVIERTPISGSYNGMQITSAAPPSSGGVTIVDTLNILENFDLTKLSNAQQAHIVAEAMRRAYFDRAEYLGDTDFVEVPIQRLINKDYAKIQAQSIDLEEATESDVLSEEALGTGGGENTTHFSIVDSKGNRVAATMSINYPFGSGFIAPGTGMLLNDEMDDFSAKPGVPNVYGLIGNEKNAIAPNKRPLSSMSPTFVENGDEVVVLGTPGGSRIITMVLLGILDYTQGGDAKSMVAKRRFHHQFRPDMIQHESGTFTDHDKEYLEDLGHVLLEGNYLYGDLQVVIHNKKTGAMQAASDPRGPGVALVK
jgi:gamma-glutamyltranspeptidase/glutathione hydrolase